MTLDGVAITHTSGSGRAAIDCAGNATIVLAEGSENFVSNTVDNCAAIRSVTNATLTIRGTGSLDAYSSGRYGAGIGAASESSNSTLRHCGNIVIEGGTITATGGYAAAGVGAAAWSSPCGDITITSNAVVTATGGAWAAGVGAASDSSPCGDITIAGNASVTATSTAQSNAHAAGIGAADYSQCGSIVISTTGTIEAQGVSAPGIGSDRGVCSGITITSGTITGRRGGLLAISVDPFTKEQRTLYSAEGELTSDGAATQTLQSPWANIDGSVGIVTIGGTGQMAFGDRALNNSIQCAKFYPLYSNESENFAEGQTIDRSAIIYYSRVDAATTEALQHQATSLAQQLPEGWNGAPQVLHNECFCPDEEAMKTGMLLEVMAALRLLGA